MGRIAAIAVTLMLVVAPASLARPADDVIAITSGPAGETTATSATFAFSSGRVVVASATCALDGAPEATCASPVSYTGLALGPHRFVVRAYDARGNQIGSDSSSWTIVPAGGPGPGPEPAPAPALVAQLALTTALAPPGGPVGLDASGSIGTIVETGFDLDGNGTYETKCESAKAGVVFSQVGSYTVGVQALSASGEKSVAKETVMVAGAPALPPGGATAAPQGTIVGACADGAVEQSLQPYLCPKTLVVGVAEATAPGDGKACWEFYKTPLGAVRYALKGSPVGYVNGLPIFPTVGNLVVDATAKRVTMLGAGRVEISKPGYLLKLVSKNGAFSWDVSKAGVVAGLHFPKAGSFLGLGTPAELTRPLTFTSAKAAAFSISVSAPEPFEGIASASLGLQLDNTEGLHIGSFVAQLGGFSLGPFGVKSAKLTYVREGNHDVWSGALTVGFPGGATVGGEIRFWHGYLDYLKLFWQENPGYPLGCCIFLSYLSGEYKTGSGFTAAAVLSAGPSLGTPWGTFRFAAVDPATLKLTFLAGKSFVAKAEGTLKVAGKTIGGAEIAYFPSFLFFQGALNTSFSVGGVKVIEVGVLVQGSMKSNGEWYTGGSGSICVLQIDCAGGHLAISGKGVSACIDLGIVVGGYIRWNGDWDYFWACSWNRVKAEAGAPLLRTLSAGGAASVDVRVPPGTQRRLFRVAGRGAPPRVVVEGPGGRRIEASAEFVRAPGHLVLQAPKENATYVAVVRPAAGRWRFTAISGSAPIAGIGSAGPLPSRMVRGTLRDGGGERVLRYAIAAPRGYTVSFLERGKDFERPLGRAVRRQGELRFTPAESGPRARRIEAVVESEGLVVRTEVVARFAAPPPRPLPAPRLALARQGTTVVARWLPVAGARGYRVAVTPGDGATRSFEAGPRRTAVRVTGVGLRAGALATVQALSGEGRPGRVARTRLAGEPSVRVLSASRSSIVVRCLAAGDGLCVATALAGGKEIGSGSVRLAYGRSGVLRLRLRRGASAVRLIVDVPGEGPRTTAVKLR